MKLSLITALAACWTSGTVAGLVLPHGPLALTLYSLVLLALTGLAHLGQQIVVYQLALAAFRRDQRTARQLALAQLRKKRSYA